MKNLILLLSLIQFTSCMEFRPKKPQMVSVEVTEIVLKNYNNNQYNQPPWLNVKIRATNKSSKTIIIFGGIDNVFVQDISGQNVDTFTLSESPIVVRPFESLSLGFMDYYFGRGEKMYLSRLVQSDWYYRQSSPIKEDSLILDGFIKEGRISKNNSIEVVHNIHLEKSASFRYKIE